MIILILGLLGICFGSFVNALVWRLREQEQRAKGKGQSKKAGKSRAAKLGAQDLSILKGRSMCPECHHTLSGNDLIPILSWLELRGKCRYCHKPISWQYPLVELATGALFVASYIWWPQTFTASGVTNFVVWCVLLVGFMALFVYDLRWLELPNRIIYPLIGLSAIMALLNLTVFHGGVAAAKDLALSLVIGFGLFYALYELSKGKWIGGGDVKLGAIIGFSIAVPLQACLVLFLSSVIGTLAIIPGLVHKKLTAKSHVPFGPFLILATIIVRLFGASIIAWYRRKFLLY